MTSTERRTPGPELSTRGENTRTRIASAARELLLEEGYDGTTMRAVAARAGVSLGNAYYYFASKDHLVQAFYSDLQREHEVAVRAALARRGIFPDRLRTTLFTWVDVARPYHAFGGTFFKVAAVPTSALSPFSLESAPARDASIALMADVLHGSDLRLPPALATELPELLWLLQMGMVLFWVHDPSEEQHRTRRLIDHTVPLLDRLLRLTRIPGVRGVTDDLLDLVRSLRTTP